MQKLRKEMMPSTKINYENNYHSSQRKKKLKLKSLLKEGAISDPKNYQRISLLPLVSKKLNTHST